MGHLNFGISYLSGMLVLEFKYLFRATNRRVAKGLCVTHDDGKNKCLMHVK